VQYWCVLLLYHACALCIDKESGNLEQAKRGGQKAETNEAMFSVIRKHLLSCGKLLSEQRKWPHDQNEPMNRLQLKLSEERHHVLKSRQQNARKRCTLESRSKSRDTGAGEKQNLQLSVTKLERYLPGSLIAQMQTLRAKISHLQGELGV